LRIHGMQVSLKALETFEVAARNLHFGMAASELNITQSAVSHQIKKLEESLQTRLFDRVGRGVMLTNSGTHLLSTVQKAFASLETGARNLELKNQEATLTVAAPSGFMSIFLLPRLSRFVARFDKLSMRFINLPPGPTKADVNADITIAMNKTSFPNMSVLELLELTLYPICSPSLVQMNERFELEDMKHQTLVHDDDGSLFSKWFSSVGLDQPKSQRNIYVQNSRDALDVVRSGIGFTLGDNLLERANLIDRSFLAPFERRIRHR